MSQAIQVLPSWSPKREEKCRMRKEKCYRTQSCRRSCRCILFSADSRIKVTSDTSPVKAKAILIAEAARLIVPSTVRKLGPSCASPNAYKNQTCHCTLRKLKCQLSETRTPSVSSLWLSLGFRRDRMTAAVQRLRSWSG